jgi:hypothetical protein
MIIGLRENPIESTYFATALHNVVEICHFSGIVLHAMSEKRQEMGGGSQPLSAPGSSLLVYASVVRRHRNGAG